MGVYISIHHSAHLTYAQAKGIWIDYMFTCRVAVTDVQWGVDLHLVLRRTSFISNSWCTWLGRFIKAWILRYREDIRNVLLFPQRGVIIHLPITQLTPRVRIPSVVGSTTCSLAKDSKWHSMRRRSAPGGYESVLHFNPMMHLDLGFSSSLASTFSEKFNTFFSLPSEVGAYISTHQPAYPTCAHSKRSSWVDYLFTC